MSDVFISYAREDRAFAKALATALVRAGWEVFWDSITPPGETWRDFLERELMAAKSVIVLWSKHSIASEWVKEEAQIGVDRSVLIPLLIEPVEIPFGFKRIQAISISHWMEWHVNKALEPVLRAVQRKVGAKSSGENQIVVGDRLPFTSVSAADPETLVLLAIANARVRMSPDVLEDELTLDKGQIQNALRNLDVYGFIRKVRTDKGARYVVTTKGVERLRHHS